MVYMLVACFLLLHRMLLSVASYDIHKYCHSLHRSDLLDVACVLFRLVSIGDNDSTFYLLNFDAVLIQTFIQHICIF